MFNETFVNASTWAGDKYVYANPASKMGDPNHADRMGYELVAITPSGMMIYRLASQKRWREWKKSVDR